MSLRVARPERADGETTAEGADGISECPGGSPHERGALAQATDPGTSSRPTNPSVCGTQAKDCFRGPGSVQRSSLNGLSHRSCAVDFRTACGLPAWLAGGRGS